MSNPKTITVSHLVSEAYAELDRLSSELRAWAKRKTYFASTERYSRTLEAIEALDWIERRSIPKKFGKLVVTASDFKAADKPDLSGALATLSKRVSRYERAQHVAMKLYVVKDRLLTEVHNLKCNDTKIIYKAMKLHSLLEFDALKIENIDIPGAFE